MLKTLFIILLLANTANAETAANAEICAISNYTANAMSSMHTTEYQNYILESVAQAENESSITFGEIAEKAKSAYKNKRHPYLNNYTPYALLNLIIHAALQSNMSAFEGSLGFTLDLCEDFNKKQHSICIMKSDAYSPSKKDHESLCSNFGISSVMDSVCESANTISAQKQDFFKTAKITYKTLRDMNYFADKENLKVPTLDTNAGVAFAGGMVMLMGRNAGKVLVGQYANSKTDMDERRVEKEKDMLVEMCKQGNLPVLHKQLLTYQ